MSFRVKQEVIERGDVFSMAKIKKETVEEPVSSSPSFQLPFPSPYGSTWTPSPQWIPLTPQWTPPATPMEYSVPNGFQCGIYPQQSLSNPIGPLHHMAHHRPSERKDSQSILEMMLRDVPKKRAPRKPRTKKSTTTNVNSTPSPPTAEQVKMIRDVYWSHFYNFMYRNYYCSPLIKPAYMPYRPRVAHPSWFRN